MDTLIRSARLLKEPVLLSAKLKRSEPAAPAPEPAPDPQSFASEPMLAAQQPEDSFAQQVIDDSLAQAYAQPAYPQVLHDDREEQERALRRQQEELLAREQQIEEEKQKAVERGYTEGYNAGAAAAEEAYSQRLAQLQALISGAIDALTRDIAGVEDAALEIVFTAVAKILGKALVEGDGVTAIVREVINHAKNRENLVIRVSPADFAVLEQNRGRLLVGIEDGKVELVADDRVQLGGCLLETAGGNLDGRLEVQVQQLRDTLSTARAAAKNG